MKAYLKVVRNGEIYEVTFREERIWDAICVYKYNPDAKIFKRKKIKEYLKCCIEEMAVRLGGLNRSDEEFLVQLAEYTIDMMLAAEKEANERAVLTAKQQAYLAKMSS